MADRYFGTFFLVKGSLFPTASKKGVYLSHLIQYNGRKRLRLEVILCVDEGEEFFA